jgi:hypothetical protein
MLNLKKLIDDNVFLIDSIKNFENLDFSKYSEPKIITFNYIIHKELEKRGISHKISDSYLSDEELESIQENSYKFSKWFENKNFNQYLEYEGVKIGRLICHELFVYLLPFLKKFFEIKKICQKYSGALFHTSTELGKITKQFSNNIKEDLQSNKTEFLFDSFILDNAFFKIKISKQNYNRLKQFSDKVLKIFFPIKHESNFDILLVEFNTKKFSELFKSLNNSGLKTLFYGLKRPAVWDKNSFSIMKQSNCKIALYSDFFSEEIKIHSKYHTQKLLENLDDLLKNEIKLNEFFSLFDTSFWCFLKPIFKNLCKKYIKDIVSEVDISRNILQKYSPKIILVLSESSKTDQIIISQAQILGIPFYLIQHGLGYDTPEGHFWNQFTGSLPIESSKFLVWGDSMMNYAKTYDIPLSKVKKIGSVAHDPVFLQNLENQKIEYILLAIEGPRHTNIHDYTNHTNDEYLIILKTIFETIHNSGKKLLVKFHPNESEINKTSIESLLNPSVKIIKTGDIISYIPNCELLLTMSITTSILDAQILKKPVLRISFREWMGKPDVCRKISSPVTTINNFESTFNKILNNLEFRQQIISDGDDFVHNCLSFPGTSSLQFSKILKNFLNSSK